MTHQWGGRRDLEPLRGGWVVRWLWPSIASARSKIRIFPRGRDLSSTWMAYAVLTPAGCAGFFRLTKRAWVNKNLPV